MNNRTSKKTKLIVTSPDNTKRAGVYVILNPVEKRAYIGETIDMFRRFSEHIRSLYNLEDNTNIALKEDFNNESTYPSYLLFPLLWTMGYEKRLYEGSDRTWLKHEAVYMYLFRKHGYTLYNDDSDNTGKKRSFLTRKGWDSPKVYEALLSYVDEEGKSRNEWESLIEEAELELEHDFRRQGLIVTEACLDQCESVDRDSLIQNWKNIVIRVGERREEKDNDRRFVFFNKESENAINLKCEDIAKAGLTKEDLISYGIIGKNRDDLIKMVKDGMMDRIVFISIGHYLDQGPATILKTKQYDIDNNYLNLGDTGDCFIYSFDKKSQNKQKSGICFWAFGHSSDGDIETYRRVLSENYSYKGPRFAIMPYTTSMKYAKLKKLKDQSGHNSKKRCILDPFDGETMDAFFLRMRNYYSEEIERAKGSKEREKERPYERFAYGYSLFHNKGKTHPYPETMYPEVIKKSSRNNALLISELCYFDVSSKDFEASFFPFFESHTNRPVQNTLGFVNSRCCASLYDKVDYNKEKLMDFFRGCNELRKTDTISFILAKIEYPYVIALSYDPVEEE